MSTLICAKQCPGCGKAASLQVSYCSRCGHQFRTSFAEPLRSANASEAPALQALSVSSPRFLPKARLFRPAFVSSLLLTVFVSALLGAGWSVGKPLLCDASAAAPDARPAQSSAQRLYRTIGLTMSLYDVDQAGGSAARVVSEKDPHTLLISFQYPGQSVRVTLSRYDVSGDDFRVQEVSLYQGKTLIERHADLN